MYPILKAEKLADKIYLMVVEAPRAGRICHCEDGRRGRANRADYL